MATAYPGKSPYVPFTEHLFASRNRYCSIDLPQPSLALSRTYKEWGPGIAERAENSFYCIARNAQYDNVASSKPLDRGQFLTFTLTFGTASYMDIKGYHEYPDSAAVED